MIFAMEPGRLAQYLADREKAGRVQVSGLSRPDPKPYQVDGRAALIPITGVLTNEVTFWDLLLGTAPSLTYDEIVQALDQANADPNVDSIILEVNSPGGYVDGLDWAVLAVAASVKPVEARVSGMAASAAYWIASQAQKITATSRLSQVGSIGVAVAFFVDPQVVDIASTAAPAKRPDLTSEEGKAMVRKELDAIAAVFASDVARGRGVAVDTVNSSFGKGGMVIASEALALGMLDAVAMPNQANQQNSGVAGAADKAKQMGGGNNFMTLEQIKAEHPELVAALREEGVQAERKRVSGLNAWKGINADADKAVEEAVASGKSYEEVASQLAAAAAKGNGKTADGENAPGVKTAAPENGAGVGAALDEVDQQAMALFGLSPEAMKAYKAGRVA